MTTDHTSPAEGEVLLEVKGLTKYFPILGGILQREVGAVKAVESVDFNVRRGETLGIVGESGCGKTTLGRLILNLIKPTAGEVHFKGKLISDFHSDPDEVRWQRDRMRKTLVTQIPGIILFLIGVYFFAVGPNENLFLWLPLFLIGGGLSVLGVRFGAEPSPMSRWLRQEIQVVFQDPYASLNSRLTVEKTLSEPILYHRLKKEEEIEPYLVSLLEEVGLTANHLERFPHEFSGGQRQRITVARALVLQPELIVLDEPTASADVSVRAKVLNMLKRLQEQRGLTYLLISHDLSIVEYVSDRILVMYLGHIVEFGPKFIFQSDDMVHPYTKALYQAIPQPDPERKVERIILKGDVPSPVNPPSGCVFHPRCPSAMKVCQEVKPLLREVGVDHQIACHLYDPEIMHNADTTPLEVDTVASAAE